MAKTLIAHICKLGVIVPSRMLHVGREGFRVAYDSKKHKLIINLLGKGIDMWFQFGSYEPQAEIFKV